MEFYFATVGRGKIVSSFLSAARYFDNFHFEAVYSRNAENGKEFAEKYGCNKVYTTLDEIIADEKINCVYVASPNSLHCSQTVALLRGGKNVLCEKPLGTNAGEVREMIAAAKESGSFLMEAYKTFLVPNLFQIKEHLHKVGKIRNVLFTLSKYSTRYDAHKRGENVNTFKASFGGGAMADIGIYLLYPLLILFGRPRRTVSMSLPVGTNEEEYPITDGVTSAIFDYGSFIATVNTSKVSFGYSASEIQGEEGTILIDNINDPTKIEVISGGKRETFALPQKKYNMYYEIAEFFECIEKKLPEPITFDHSLSLIGAEIIDEIRKNGNIVYPADKRVDKPEKMC